MLEHSAKSAPQANAASQIITPASIDPTQHGKITLEQIMADPDWIGRQPQDAYWADNSQGVYYQQKRAGEPLKDLWYRPLSADNNGQKVTLAQLHQNAYGDRVISNDKKYAAWTFDGNLYCKNLQSGKVRQLTRGTVKASQLAFLNDDRLSFQAGDQLQAINLNTGFVELLASWKFADKPVAVKKPADFIAAQQQKLIQVIAKRRADKVTEFNYRQKLQSEDPTATPQAFYFDKAMQTVDASLSPNGKWLVVAVTKKTKRNKNDIMPSYVNEDGRIAAKPARQRVADAKPVTDHLWLLDLVHHRKHQLSYKSLPGYNEDVLAKVKQENARAEGKTYTPNRLPRAIGLMQDWYWYGGAIQWNHSGDKVAVMLKAWDNKDRWIATVNVKTPTLQTQERLHDDAWVNYRHNQFGWLNHQDKLYYLSEKSGYANLYTQVPGKAAKPLVQGHYVVDELTLTDNDQYIYYKANQPHPGIYEIYRVNVATGKIEQMTKLRGMTDYKLSPDESKLLLTHSELVLPPELYEQDAVPGAKVTRLTHTVSKKFLSMPWTAPTIVPVPSSHTKQPIYAKVYLPKNDQQGKPRRAVMFTHGAGYLQNSHLGWSAYFREFMFHCMLVQQGYVVMDMDYRASAGYGREWRTAIYRHMGKPELQDLRDGVNWMVKNANVDRHRIGTYGGSYGGFLTYMAMFKTPDLFQAGAALRPVADWAHYNFGYTSDILNTPDVDPIAYKQSSPIYFADGLQKPLLINAPMVDTNVFFEGNVRMVQRLIELKKQNFEIALFPVESHGFIQPSSWLNEYRRIYKLFQQNL